MEQMTGLETAGRPDDRREITVGPMVIDRANRTARVGDEPVALTASEFDLVWYLASRAGQVVTRDELYTGILQMEYDGLNRCLDLRISRIRRKLGDRHSGARIIKSVRSEGYQLTTNWGEPGSPK